MGKLILKNSEKWITKEIYYDGSTYQCKMTQHGVMLIVLSVYDYEIGDKEETAESIITDHKLGYEVYDENGNHLSSIVDIVHELDDMAKE
mgnify:CR=1 FL=1